MQDRCFFEVLDFIELEDIYQLAKVKIRHTGEIVHIYKNDTLEKGCIYRGVLKPDVGELAGNVYEVFALEDYTRESTLLANTLAKCRLHNPDLAGKIIEYNGLFDSRQEIINSNLNKEDKDILITEIEKIVVKNYVPEFLNDFPALIPSNKLELKKYFGATIFERPYILLHYNIELIDLLKDIECRRWKTDEVVIKCIIYHQLVLAYEGGNTYVEEKDVIKETKKTLKKLGFSNLVKGALISKVLSNEWGDVNRDTIDDVPVVCINLLYLAEIGIAKIVLDLSKREYDIDELEINEAIKEKCNISLNKEQGKAVIKALKNSISIINGAPGTGKTAVTKSLIEIFRYLYPSGIIKTVAPTGKAVERLNNATGIQGQTIHRLLKLSSNFVVKEEQEIECNLLIIDEATMCSSKLFYELLRTFYKNKNIRIVVLGDSNQLPAVEPGEVFEDLCSSGIVTVTTLTQVYRQNENSLIYENLCRINKGEFELEYDDKEFKFIESAGSLIVDHVIEEFHKAIDEGFDYEEVQVVAPNGRYDYGTEELNKYISSKINYSETRKANKFEVLDKVMQMKNNYEIEVYNGETGIVCASQEKRGQRTITVRFENNKEVKYNSREVEQLDLSYALTIHKMQGSSADVIILVATDKKKLYLNRKMLYVALSRAKKKVVVIGNKEYFIRGLSSPYIKRKTLLLQKIKEYLHY